MKLKHRYRLAKIKQEHDHTELCVHSCKILRGLDWGGWVTTIVALTGTKNVFSLTMEHKEDNPSQSAIPEIITICDTEFPTKEGTVVIPEVKFVRITRKGLPVSETQI